MSLIVYKTAPDRDATAVADEQRLPGVHRRPRAEAAARLQAEIHPDIVVTALAQTDETGSSYPDCTGGWDAAGVPAVRVLPGR
jgi:hypothetical protein